MKRAWIVVAVVLLAACSSTPTASTQSPSPSATATSDDYGMPPAGVPLIYVADPRHAGWYIGVDWSGKPRGTVKLAQPLGPLQTLVQAPDGSGFMIPPFKALSGGFFDRLGAPVSDPDAQGHQVVMWGDDSKHLCTLDAVFTGGQLKGQWQLGLKTPGAATMAHPVALNTSNWSVGIEAIDFASCSPKNDRAVLTYNVYGRPTDLYVVRISDGAVLQYRTYPTNVLAGITASADARLAADNSSTSIGALMPPNAPHTTVWRVADRSVVATLDPKYYVVAFSRDDTGALVSTSPLASGAPTNLALIRLTDGAVLWNKDSGQEYGGAWVRPDGNDVAFQLGPPQGPVGGPSELVIVHPDGTATSLRFQ